MANTRQDKASLMRMARESWIVGNGSVSSDLYAAISVVTRRRAICHDIDDDLQVYA